MGRNWISFYLFQKRKTSLFANVKTRFNHHGRKHNGLAHLSARHHPVGTRRGSGTFPYPVRATKVFGADGVGDERCLLLVALVSVLSLPTQPALRSATAQRDRKGHHVELGRLRELNNKQQQPF